jgi:hypothetical protein
MRSESVRYVLSLGLGLVACLYVVQLVRPLDLQPDSVCYLRVAELGAEGHGFDCAGCDRRHCSIAYPPGYPVVLAALIRADLAVPQAFVLVNLVCLAAGLLAAIAIWRRAFGISLTAGLGLACLMLLWYPVFRLVNNPLSDFLFFGLALGAVYLALLARDSGGWHRWGLLGIATVLAYAAFEVRTVGIALAPALAWAALAPGQGATLRRRLAHPRAIAVGALGAVVAAALILRHSQYVTVDLKTQYGNGLLATLLRVAGYRLTELGELAVNVPAGKLPAAAAAVIPPCGAVLLVALLYCLWRRRRLLGPPEVFALGLAAIMSIWPFEDARFWLPVLPIFLGLLAWGVRPALARVATRSAAAVVVGLFVAIGLAGEAYNTRVSFSGNGFPMLFADDYLGPVYRAAWGMRSPGDTLPVDSTALHVLQRFEPAVRRPGR